ncbi:MAG: sugar kinase [Erysipelotrichaceae bacterium]
MKVVTFGEIMLRLTPSNYDRFSQSQSFQATYGGGEANVAVSLANYGINASFVSKLPTHAIGQCAINDLRKYGVDTSFITRGGERVGIYYLEKGASQRASQVIYDRAHSSIAEAVSTDFDWDVIFKDVDFFHFTGITPALNKEVALICMEACAKAKEKNITISCDLNFRKKLWSSEDANITMSKLMKYVDVCIANEEDADKVFGIKAYNNDVTRGELNHDGYINVAKQLMKRFNFTHVAITLRESLSASDNNWSAMLYDGKDAYFSKKYQLRIVDRVGGGDSFGAGLIYAMLHQMKPQETIEFAVGASALKHSIEGDYNRVSVDEVSALVAGDGSGRVQR